MSLQERVARAMYERAHPRSPQWSDVEIDIRKKWLRLAAEAMGVIQAHNEQKGAGA